MTVPVKVCGNTRLEDARLAAEMGAHMLGFIFYAPSPRSVAPEKAAAIIRDLPPYVVAVGVFVNEKLDRMNQIATECRLDRIQLHGNEPYETIRALVRPAYRAFRLREQSDLTHVVGEPDSCVLLDTYDSGIPGGTGRTFDWTWARKAAEVKQVILAGGLGAHNVAEAVAAARPAAVDVLSSLESSPGKKDSAKVEAFFSALRSFERLSTLSMGKHASAS